MQGAEELCVLLLSSNRSVSYTKFAEKYQSSFLQKTTSKIRRLCPSSENSETSKMASSASQFKVGEELVPAELCQRTSRSLKLPRKWDPSKFHPHLPFLPRCSKSRIHLLTQTQPSSGSSMSKIFETPQARRGTLAAQLNGEPDSTAQKSRGSFA